MKIDILTLFPEACNNFLSESIIGRARQANLVEINLINIRDFSKDKHHKVDDTPYGGGMGMVMSPQPIYDAYLSLVENNNKPYTIYMSPKGKPFNQQKAVELEQQIVMKERELDELQKQFEVYKAKMESLLISQLELLKEVNKD